MSLKSKAVDGGFITLYTQLIKFVARIATISIMARYITPEEYGVVAIALAFAHILQVFREAGLSTAIVQRPQIDQVELSTIFWCSVAFGFAALVLSAIAGLVASAVFEQEALLYLLPAFGLLGLAASINVQKVSLLLRELRFRQISIADLISVCVGAVVGIVLAVQGYGIWALFALEAASTLSFNIVIRYLHPWKVSFVFDLPRVRPMLSYGFGILVSQVVDRVQKSLDPLLIGYFLGTQPTGIYNRAQGLLNTPLRTLLGPLNGVSRSFVFRTTEDPERFTRSVLTILNLMLLTGSVLMVASLASATVVVEILLGAGWDDVIPVFMALAILAFVEPAMSFLATVLISKGRSRTLFWFSMASIGVMGTGLLVAVQFGLVFVALAYSLLSLFVRFPLLVTLVAKTTDLPARRLFACTVAPLTASALAGVTVLYFFARQDVGDLFVAGICAISSLCLFLLVYHRFASGRETLQLVIELVGSRYPFSKLRS